MRRHSVDVVSVLLVLGGLVAVVAECAAAPQAPGSTAARTAILDHRGRAQLERGQLAAAEETFAKALTLDPNDPAAHQGLGRVAMRRHRYRKALTLFLRARELYAHRVAEADAGRMETVAELERYRQSASDQGASFSDTGCLTERGVELWAGDSTTDERPLEHGEIDLRGTPPGLSFRIGTCQLHLGNLEAARTELERELLIDPGNAAAHLNLAVALYRLGDPHRALEELDTAVERGAAEPRGLRAEILSSMR